MTTPKPDLPEFLMDRTPDRSPHATPARRSRMLRRIAAPLVVALVAGAGVAALASPHHGGDDHHGRMHAAGHPDAQGGAAMLPLQGRGLERMLDRLEASAEQRTQIQAIAQAVRADLEAGREAGQALRAQMADLFAQPSIDAAAVETVRQQMMARHDQASQRMTQAMLEIGQVLTPAQRSQLAEWRQARAERMAEHGRDGRRQGQ